MSEQLHQKIERSGRISRRSVLKAMGFASLTMAAGDVLAPQFMYGSKEGRVGVLEAGFTPENERAVLVMGGFGVRNSEPIAKALQPALGVGRTIMYADYPRDGLNIQATMNQFADTCEQLQISRAALVGHSMGGSIALAGLAYKRNIMVSDMVLLSSPFSGDNIKQNKSFAQSWAKVRYPGGPVSQLGTETYQNAIAERLEDHSLWGQLTESWRRATTGVSPRLKASQVQFLCSIKPYSYANYLPNYTTVHYIAPIDGAADKTVDVEASIASWRGFVGSEQFNEVRVDGIGHANPVQRPSEYVRAIAPLCRTAAQNSALARKSSR